MNGGEGACDKACQRSTDECWGRDGVVCGFAPSHSGILDGLGGEDPLGRQRSRLSGWLQECPVQPRLVKHAATEPQRSSPNWASCAGGS